MAQVSLSVRAQVSLLNTRRASSLVLPEAQVSLFPLVCYPDEVSLLEHEVSLFKNEVSLFQHEVSILTSASKM